MFFLLSFSNLQKSTRTSFWNQNTQKDFQNPPEMDPRGPQKQYFPGFLEFFISMPLSAIIAVFACPGASSSFQDAAKKQLGTYSQQKRSRHCSFATFSRKCLKMGSRRGSRGGSANHFFATFFSLVSYGVSRGALDRSNAPQGSQNEAPGLPKRSPGAAKTLPNVPSAASLFNLGLASRV